MDNAEFYHLLPVIPPQPQHFYPGKPPVPAPYPYPWDSQESEAPNRIAHTLTACCRCRQRKTRCDPTLPRCLPCERSGSTCEYYDSTKGKRINRSYVVNLQKRVRQLEADLSQYTDEESDYPHSYDDMVRPGGMVRLGETGESARYLGPSSGIAMTRLLMEEAKRYTESQRIADLIPELRARRIDRRDRMQSIVTGGSISGPSSRKRSFPANSVIPAPSLPSRETVDGLVRIFNERVQVFTPILHEKVFREDLEAVFAGDKDPYRHFIVNMVVAISLQKMDGYPGLAASYYLSAMQHFEDVVRPKDLKTLQCLCLIGQYSLLTPTRTATYYIIGLAVRICQQLGLGDERTIAVGSPDPQTLDMRRRLSWIVTTQEFGLSHIMGRPNGFAKSDDLMNVEFFEAVADGDITPEGIHPGRPCERKAVAIYFCKMRLLQAEIRRMLYEKSRPEPTHESHPWFAQVEQKLKDWLEDCPEQPPWCKPWFTGRYHNMIISIYRPSPQVPRPTSQAAAKCFVGSRYIIGLTSRQVQQGAVDVTWVFLLTIYSALNALLWSISYPEVRAEHPQTEVEDLARTALETITNCSDRWPGSSSAIQLYTVFANACLQSYQVKEETPSPVSSSQLDTPVSYADPLSPESDMSGSTHTQAQSQVASSLFNRSPFGYVFEATPELPAEYGFDGGHIQNQPTFRSNSIFMSPSSDSNGRRLSNLAPDSSQSHEGSAPERLGTTPPPPMMMHRNNPSPAPPATPISVASLPTPPESLAPPPSVRGTNTTPSPRLTPATQTATPNPTPTLRPVSPAAPSQHPSPAARPIVMVKQEPLTFPPEFKRLPQHYHHQQQQQQQSCIPLPRTTQRTAAPTSTPPAFTIPPPPHQRPLPSAASAATVTVTDWFNPPPPFISPHAFSGGGAGAGARMAAPPPPSFLSPWDVDAAAPNPFIGLGLGGNETGTGSQPPSAQTQTQTQTQGHAQGQAQGQGQGQGQGGWNIPWQAQSQQQQQQHHPGGNGGSGFGVYNGFGFPPSSASASASSAAALAGFGGGGGLLGQRHGSLSHEQQLELMDVLETEGMQDIEGFLSMGMGAGGIGMEMELPVGNLNGNSGGGGGGYTG